MFSSLTGWAPMLLNDVPVDARCVNEGAKRADGTFCRERAEENGWCVACWAEIEPR